MSILNRILIMSAFMSFLNRVLTMHKIFSMDGAMHPKKIQRVLLGGGMME